MWNAIFLLLGAAFLSLQNVVRKHFKKVCKSGDLCFSALTAACAIVVFGLVILFSSVPAWDPSILLFSCMFAFTYGAAIVFHVLAIGCGSLARTTLITSYSLLIPTVYGVLFLQESFGMYKFIGVLLLSVSLYVTNYSKNIHKSQMRWVIYTVLSFLGYGLCSTVQKVEPLYCSSDSTNVFMLLAFFITAVVLITISFVRDGREQTVFVIKNNWQLATLCGSMNGMVNLFVMILGSQMAASVMFPILSAGNIIITVLMARFLYRERLGIRQMIGFAAGIGAVILLNF